MADDLLDDLRRLRETAESYGQGRTADAFARAIVEIIHLRARPGWREGVEAAASAVENLALSTPDYTKADQAEQLGYRRAISTIHALKEPT